MKKLRKKDLRSFFHIIGKTSELSYDSKTLRRDAF